MAVAIRLKRLGRRHRAFFRIEAIERRNARGGRSLETLGYYDPMLSDPNKENVQMDLERIRFWLDRGARPSETVTSFLRKKDISWGNPKKKSRKALARKRKREQKGGK